MTRVITDAESIEALAAEWPVDTPLPAEECDHGMPTDLYCDACTIDKLIAERDEMKAEVANHENDRAGWTECAVVMRDRIAELEAERDALAGRVAELEAEREAAPLRPEEQRAVLADPGMLVRLIGYHDAQEAAGDAFAEGWGKFHERRALELLAIGRKVIAEDPGIWEPEIIAEFKPRFSERAALTTPESKP